MSCPHSSAPGSSPQTCSQCLVAKPRVVTVQNRVVSLDGQVLGEIGQLSRLRMEEETQSTLPTKKKRCGRCQEHGHNARTCNVDNQAAREYDRECDARSTTDGTFIVN